MNIKSMKKPLFKFDLLNIAIFIILILYLLDNIINLPLKSVRSIIFIFFIISIFIFFLKFKTIKIYLCISIITVFCFDLFFNLFFQSAFHEFKVRPLIKDSVQKSVIYMDEWPYYKFKPDMIVKTAGERGDDCTYTWKTDKLGFKNESVQNNYDFVALGDSYVEGMCSKLEETFPYILSEQNIKTYNLGTQGYSDKQAISALKILEDNKINYDGIIFGYLTGRHMREENYINRPKKPVGGLGAIVNRELRAGKSFFVTRNILQEIFSDKFSTKFLNYTKNKKNPKSNIFELKKEYKDIQIPIKLIPLLFNENSARKNLDLNNNKFVEISHQAILNLAIKTKKEKKIFIFFMFPASSDIFGDLLYEGNYICQTDYYKEFTKLKNLVKDENVIILDIFEEAKILTKKWILTNNYDYFIWKTIDPHYSAAGNKIISKVIVDYLKNNNQPNFDYLKKCG